MTENMRDNYKIRCYFDAHDSDVRTMSSMIMPNGDLVTGSRDLTIKIWKSNESDQGFVETACLLGPNHYISSLCILPPSTEHPFGLLLVGSHDSAIYGFSLETYQQVFKLLGHSGPVAALASGNFGTIVSGSWDKTARVWVGQKSVLWLTGHQAAVWAVAMFPEQGVTITGSADKTIRLWRAGKTEKIFHGHEDCVRGLAIVSATEFLSCSNDSTVRLWQTNGTCLNVFTGHTSYVYDIAVLNENGDFVTCSEDRTFKIWKNGELYASKEVPSSCLWSIACLANGDIAVGGSNGRVYIFTPHDDLKASDAVIAKFENDIVQLKQKANNSKENSDGFDTLPGLEALAVPGETHGQKIMCRNGTNVSSYQWDSIDKIWVKLGDLFSDGDSEGDNITVEKREYEGKRYDYVFTIDVEGGILLKLPYNNGDNPWVAAQSFINKHNLNAIYMDQIVDYIVTNTSSAPRQNNAPVFSDPFTGVERYVPPMQRSFNTATEQARLAITSSAPPTGSASSIFGTAKLFPKLTYVNFALSNLKGIEKKLIEFSKILGPESALSLEEIKKLLLLADNPKEVTSGQMESFQKILDWREDLVFPALDLFRLAIRSDVFCRTISNAGVTTIAKYLLKHLSTKNLDTNVMLTMRIFCNFFGTKFGDELLTTHVETICAAVNSCIPTEYRPTEVAVSTLYLNYSVAVSKSHQNGMLIAERVVAIFKIIKDFEALFRFMICVGTLMEDDAAATVIRSAGISEYVKTCLAHEDLPSKAQECAKHLLKCIDYDS